MKKKNEIITLDKPNTAVTVKFSREAFCVLADLACAGNMLINGYRADDTISDYESVTINILGVLRELEIKPKEDISPEAIKRRIESYYKLYQDDGLTAYLARRLAERDYGAERTAARDEAEDKYLAEFGKHGFENVRVDIKGT